MKNYKHKKFKIIPFCISLLIVLLITGGISVYTTFYYGGTDLKFLEGYLSLDNNKNNSTIEYIEKTIELEKTGYLLAPEELGLSFRDPETKMVFGPEKNNDIFAGSVTNYYKNGIMHVEGYFDVALFLTLTTTENVEEKIETDISYTFYFFNINYANLSNSAANVQIAFVDGVDNRTSDEYEGDETHIGDLALQEAMDVNAGNLFTGDTLSMEYTYTYNNKGMNAVFPVYDKGANVEGTDLVVSDPKSRVYVYKSTLFNNRDGKKLTDFERATFSIYLYDEEKESVEKNLVEGTINNVLDLEEAEKLTLNKGYTDVYYKNPEFIKHTWSTLLIATGISLAISSVIATLFYLIWIDERPTTKKNKK